MSGLTDFALPTRRALLKRIDQLAATADAKVLLAQLADVTERIGDAMIEVGRRILIFVFEAIKLFPHMTLGVTVALVMKGLIASAAFVGLLTPLLGPLLIAFGLGAGAMMDVADGGFRVRLEQFLRSFDVPTRD